MSSAGPLISVNFGLNTGGYHSAIRSATEDSDKMINSLRWMGRDLMRVGSEIDKVSMYLGKGWQFLTTQSSDLVAGLGDINWAFGDIADILGTSVAPAFNYLADSMDPVINFLDTIPDFAKLVIVGFIVLAMLIPKLYSLFFKLGGFFSLLRGSWKALSREGGVFKTVLGMIWQGFRFLLGMSEPMKLSMDRQREAIKKQKDEAEALIKTLERHRDEEKKGSKEAKDYTHRIDAQKKLLTSLQSQLKSVDLEEETFIKRGKKGEKGSKGLITKFKGLFKSLKDSKKGFTSLAGGILVAGAAIGGMTLLSAAFGPIMEALTPIFESLEMAMQPLSDLLYPISEYISDLIDKCPALGQALGGLTIAAVALAGAISIFGTKAVLGVITKVGSFIGTQLSGAISGAFGADLLSGLELAALPVAILFAPFFLSLIAKYLGWLEPIEVPLPIKPEAIPTAAWGNIPLQAQEAMAAGYAAAGEKQKGFLADWAASIQPQVSGLWTTLGNAWGAGIQTLRDAWGGFALWAFNSWATLSTGIQSIGGQITSFLSTAFTNPIAALQNAFGGLHDSLVNSWNTLMTFFQDSFATWKAVFQPLVDFFNWLRGLLGLGATTTANISGDFKITYAGEKPPGIQKGGIIRKEGLAYLHAAEVVTPANQAPAGGNQFFVTNTFENPVFTSSADMNKFADMISEKLRKQLDALGSGR